MVFDALFAAGGAIEGFAADGAGAWRSRLGSLVTLGGSHKLGFSDSSSMIAAPGSRDWIVSMRAGALSGLSVAGALSGLEAGASVVRVRAPSIGALAHSSPLSLAWCATPSGALWRTGALSAGSLWITARALPGSVITWPFFTAYLRASRAAFRPCPASIIASSSCRPLMPSSLLRRISSSGSSSRVLLASLRLPPTSASRRVSELYSSNDSA